MTDDLTGTPLDEFAIRQAQEEDDAQRAAMLEALEEHTKDVLQTYPEGGRKKGNVYRIPRPPRVGHEEPPRQNRRRAS